ncbi:MAG: dihydrofolate reductase [Paludibacter sp.]|nr:dihydrofolate reductase [Bacteroidales bacterium]MCM1069888.1 dihydrofolate reductase [Prevotella sp.]MCM1354569.1 dihydrofolate reductase [Bacteroides sp.]MCM1443464.1 dihydrofolate reductase [Muribaculum sp.]MCM1482548.1 dihydrofolate reductase [Paludibacter sp.]
MISIIVAVAQANAIGQQGGLLCHLPDDLKHFKAITSGHTVIMGKRTYYSLPHHPLPNRRNIVITDIAGEKIAGADTVYSIEEALRCADSDRENFVIGGGMVYRQFMPLADKLYITHIDAKFPLADTFFPEISDEEWEQSSSESHAADDRNPYPYTFAEYMRKPMH